MRASDTNAIATDPAAIAGACASSQRASAACADVEWPSPSLTAT
jgi:hypothetical protein